MRAAFYSMIVAAGAAALLVGCSKAPESASSEPGGTVAATPVAVPEISDAEKQSMIATLPAPYNTGSFDNGRKQFALCRSCHTVTPGGPSNTGPNLYGVFGRQAGSLEGFKYSEALKGAGFVWDAEKLDSWLTDPRGFLPGNRMSFMGVKDPQKRLDLIAYLKVESGFKPAE